MLRRQIREEVLAIKPLDLLESKTIDNALAWIDSGVELCRLQKPATPPTHLVSYFAVLDGDYILLVDHINAGLWLPTGGHVEPQEHPRETVRREAQEELGIRAAFALPHPVFITSTETVGATAGHTDVSLWYLLNEDRHNSLSFDGAEFRSIRWFLRTEVPHERTDPHMSRFLRKLAQVCPSTSGPSSIH